MLIVVIVGVVVGVTASMLISGDSQMELLGLVVVALMMVGLVGRYVRVTGIDWLAPPVLLAGVVGLYYLVRPAGLLAGLQPLTSARGEMGVAVSLVVAVVGGFWIGYLLPLGEAVGASMPWAVGRWSRRRLQLVVGVCWLGGVLCWAGMIYKSGGVVERITTYGGGSATGLGVIITASAALLGGAVVIGWLGYIKGLVSRGMMAVVMVSGLVLLAGHGQRGALLVPLVMVVAIYHYLVRRLRGRDVVVMGLIGALLLVGLGVPRLRLVRNTRVAMSADDYARIGGWFLLRNLSSFDAIMLAVEKVPGEVGYQWGRSYTDAVGMLIPRQINKDKPQRNLFNRVLRKHRAGSMAMPIAAEGYINFGLAGLLVEAVLLGMIYRALYVYRGRHQENVGAVVTYALAIAFFGLVWRGGLLGGHLGLLLMYVMLLAGAMVICGGWRSVEQGTS